MSISSVKPAAAQQAPHAAAKTTTVAHDKILQKPTEQVEKTQLAESEKHSVDMKV